MKIFHFSHRENPFPSPQYRFIFRNPETAPESAHSSKEQLENLRKEMSRHVPDSALVQNQEALELVDASWSDVLKKIGKVAGLAHVALIPVVGPPLQAYLGAKSYAQERMADEFQSRLAKINNLPANIPASKKAALLIRLLKETRDYSFLGFKKPAQAKRLLDEKIDELEKVRKKAKTIEDLGLTVQRETVKSYDAYGDKLRASVGNTENAKGYISSVYEPFSDEFEWLKEYDDNTAEQIKNGLNQAKDEAFEALESASSPRQRINVILNFLKHARQVYEGNPQAQAEFSIKMEVWLKVRKNPGLKNEPAAKPAAVAQNLEIPENPTVDGSDASQTDAFESDSPESEVGRSSAADSNSPAENPTEQEPGEDA